MNKRNPEDYRSLPTPGALAQARCDVFAQIYVQSEIVDKGEGSIVLRESCLLLQEGFFISSYLWDEI